MPLNVSSEPLTRQANTDREDSLDSSDSDDDAVFLEVRMQLALHAIGQIVIISSQGL